MVAVAVVLCGCGEAREWVGPAGARRLDEDAQACSAWAEQTGEAASDE